MYFLGVAVEQSAIIFQIDLDFTLISSTLSCDSLQYFTVQGRQQGWIEFLAEITWSSECNFCRSKASFIPRRFSTPICPSEYELHHFQGYDHSINFDLLIKGVEAPIKAADDANDHRHKQQLLDLLNHYIHKRMSSLPCGYQRWIVSVLVSTYDYTCPWFSPNCMTHLFSINFNKLLHQICAYNPIAAVKLLTNQVILIIQYLNQTLSLKSSGFQWPPHFYIPGSQRDLTPSCLATSNELSPRNVAQSSRVLVADGT